MKNEYKRWMVNTAIWVASLAVVGYAVILLTNYLVSDIKEAGPIHPLQIGVVALFGIVAVIPIMMYGAVVVGFIIGSVSKFFRIKKGLDPEKSGKN